MTKMYVTLVQAQRRLPQVRKLLYDALRLKKMIDMALSIEVQYDDDIDGVHFDTTFHKELHRLSYEFYKVIETLERKGVIIRDLDIGLIDFLSLHHGHEICFCFRLGEEKITHWHDISAGFAGRRPIEELKMLLKRSGPDRI